MAYKTRKEKRAWKKGLFVGFKKSKARYSRTAYRKRNRKAKAYRSKRRRRERSSAMEEILTIAFTTVLVFFIQQGCLWFWNKFVKKGKKGK